jgi:hypothetical protein
MKPTLSIIIIIGLGMVLAGEAGAGPRRAGVSPRANSGVTSFAGAGSNRVIFQRQFYGGYPYNYYQPYYPQVLVVSPYGPSYILPQTVVVTSPYFCVLHNDGFVSRVGMLDHLAGTHKIPLDAATSLCPDHGGSCVFPSY